MQIDCVADREKYLLKLTKIIYPESFTDDNSEWVRGRMYKFKDLTACKVIEERRSKFLFAKFYVRLVYEQKLKNVRLPKQKEWVSTFEPNPFIDTSTLSVVKRSVIKKSATDVINGMINTFSANVLICDYFQYDDFERLALKNLFKVHGIGLVYGDEI